MREKIKRLIHEIIYLCKKYSQHDIPAHSAQVSFFVMISLFPFILFLLTLIYYTPITRDTLLTVVKTIAPSSLSTMFNGWIEEIYHKASGAVMSIAAIVALYAGSRGFLGINAGLRKIYQTEDNRNYFITRFFSLLYTFVFSFMILISLLVLVYGNKIIRYITQYLTPLKNSMLLLFAFRAAVGMLIFMSFFLVLYTYVPKHSRKLRYQIPGSIFAAIGWVAFSYIYSIYIDTFSSFSSLYGSLTYIVLFMLWIYFSMNIVFVGAEINVYVEELRTRKKYKAT